MTMDWMLATIYGLNQVYKGLTLFRSLCTDLRTLNFWESGSYRDGNEVHTFFILRGTNNTVEIVQVDDVITDIRLFYHD